MSFYDFKKIGDIDFNIGLMQCNAVKRFKVFSKASSDIKCGEMSSGER